MINFNRPPLTGNEEQFVLAVMRSDKISGDGVFTGKCHKWFESRVQCKKVLLTTSCTHALEMAAICKFSLVAGKLSLRKNNIVEI